jgi:polygalacturonase
MNIKLNNGDFGKLIFIKRNVSLNLLSWQALTFYKCKNLVVKNLKIQDAQQIHVSFEKCMNVQASFLTVTAPEDSPNTDGIHVSDTKGIQISNCIIGTGVYKVFFLFFFK